MSKLDASIKKVIDNAQKKGGTFNQWWDRLAQYHALVRFFSEQPNKKDPWWKEYFKKGVSPLDAIKSWDTDCDTWQWPSERKNGSLNK